MEVISLATAIAALLAACGAAFWAGRIDGRINNGLSEDIRDTRETIGKIFTKLDTLPCDGNTERIKQCEQAIRERT